MATLDLMVPNDNYTQFTLSDLIIHQEYNDNNSASFDNNSLDYLSLISPNQNEIFEEIFNGSGLTKGEILILISNLTKLSGNIVSPGFYPISGTLEITSLLKLLVDLHQMLILKI